jgi:hypothetical protein
MIMTPPTALGVEGFLYRPFAPLFLLLEQHQITDSDRISLAEAALEHFACIT